MHFALWVVPDLRGSGGGYTREAINTFALPNLKNTFLWKIPRHITLRKIINLALQWCRARSLFGSQIPVTTERFELRISCIRSSYLTH